MVIRIMIQEAHHLLKKMMNTNINNDKLKMTINK